MTKGKVAIITGASRGIGRELSIGLANDGYNLALISRSQEALSKLYGEIKDKNGNKVDNHSLFAFDVSNTENIKNIIKDIINKYGHIDLLINNAGIYTQGTFNLSVEEFEKMLKINLVSSFAFMKEVVPIMQQQNDGYIINIASRAGKFGFSEDGGYVASKFGLVGLNESGYRELSSCGIKFTAICPGWTNTDMAVKAGTSLPGPEMIQPGDILKTVRWLLNLSPSVRIRELVIECKDSIC